MRSAQALALLLAAIFAAVPCAAQDETYYPTPWEPPPHTVVEEYEAAYFTRELSWACYGADERYTACRERIFFVRNGEVFGPRDDSDIVRSMVAEGDRFIFQWEQFEDIGGFSYQKVARLIAVKSVHFITCDYRYVLSREALAGEEMLEWWRRADWLSGDLMLPEVRE